MALALNTIAGQQAWLDSVPKTGGDKGPASPAQLSSGSLVGWPAGAELPQLALLVPHVREQRLTSR